MARKPTDIVQLKLRMRESLRQTLKRSALHHNRPLNAEIIARLGQSFTKQDQVDLIQQTVKATVVRFLSADQDWLRRVKAPAPAQRAIATKGPSQCQSCAIKGMSDLPKG